MNKTTRPLHTPRLPASALFLLAYSGGIPMRSERERNKLPEDVVDARKIAAEKKRLRKNAKRASGEKR